MPLGSARAKESAIHDRFRERIEQGLASLERRLLKARAKIDRSPVERQIGRLLGRNSRAAGRFVVELLDDPSLPSSLRLKWSVRADLDEWACYSDGCYILRTNIADWTAEDLWKANVQLTDAEAAFRICAASSSNAPRNATRSASFSSSSGRRTPSNLIFSVSGDAAITRRFTACWSSALKVRTHAITYAGLHSFRVRP
ncbi:MAG TPA: hypothetical protein VEO54_20720 [Thermoanaerobaculia bacterium]|nr:hypothetical protein [Thermoanaerobaculia bacterium]